MEDATYCPFCGRLQQQPRPQPHPIQSSSSTIVTSSMKNPGTAVLIAIIAGIFGFQGIGHMYLGKVAYGIGLLLLGWTIGILALFVLIGGGIAMAVLLWIVGIALWIWQAHNANKLAKYYNEYLVQKGVTPW
jgi:TM2 domain-containing membrane protein YozV